MMQKDGPARQSTQSPITTFRPADRAIPGRETTRPPGSKPTASVLSLTITTQHMLSMATWSLGRGLLPTSTKPTWVTEVRFPVPQ